SSLMIGYCFRTSAAASRPILTSCSGVYLFFGGVTFVCAATVVAVSASTSVRRLSRFMIAIPHHLPFQEPRRPVVSHSESAYPQTLAWALLPSLERALALLGVKDEIRFDVRSAVAGLERGVRAGGDRHAHARAPLRGRAGRVRSQSVASRSTGDERS